MGKQAGRKHHDERSSQDPKALRRRGISLGWSALEVPRYLVPEFRTRSMREAVLQLYQLQLGGPPSWLQRLSSEWVGDWLKEAIFLLYQVAPS